MDYKRHKRGFSKICLQITMLFRIFMIPIYRGAIGVFLSETDLEMVCNVLPAEAAIDESISVDD